MSKFCTICGKECVEEWTGRYDGETGEKLNRLVCPVDPCGHGDHIPEWMEPGDDRLNWLLRWTKYPYGLACRRCREMIYSGD